MPDSEWPDVGSVSDTGYHSYTDPCLSDHLVNMLLYASGRVRAPGAHGTFQEETPQGYPAEARVPL